MCLELEAAGDYRKTKDALDSPTVTLALSTVEETSSTICRDQCGMKMPDP